MHTRRPAQQPGGQRCGAVPARGTGSGVDAGAPAPGLILDRVRETGAVRVADLVARARRVGHDGAARPRDPPRARPAREGPRRRDGHRRAAPSFEPGFAAKSALQQVEKAAIADAAARPRRARHGDRDVRRARPPTRSPRASGEIPGVTVVTNSLRVADVLHRSGRRRPDDHPDRRRADAVGGAGRAVRGRAAAHASTSTSCSWASTAWTRRPGSPRPNLLEAETDRALVEAGRRLVVRRRPHEVGRHRHRSIARLDQADVLITDAGLDAAAREILRRRGARADPRRPSTEPGRTPGLAAGLDDRPSGGHGPPPCPLTTRRRPADATRDRRSAGRAPPRYNALTDEWVLVSAGRTTGRGWAPRSPSRPRTGRRTTRAATCARATRAPTARCNPAYDETFVFTNDFAALRPDTSDAGVEAGLLRAEGDAGHVPGHLLLAAPRPDHGRHGDRARSADRRPVGGRRRPSSAAVSAGSRCSRTAARRWAPRTRIPTARSGPARRCPSRPPARTRPAAPVRARPGGALLLDYARQERGGPRVVAENDGLAGRRAVLGRLAVRDAGRSRATRAARLADLDDAARDGLAAALIDLTSRYDNLFHQPFPYSMGWHQAPFDGAVHRSLAAPRPLLPAAAALGHRAQVHGRLRAPGRAAARPDAPRRPRSGCARPAAGARRAGG